MSRSAVLVTLAALLLPSAALACLWDHDTIRMERSRFPNTLELITGKFLRHSPEFYRWRIDNRLKRLEADPSNVALLDDLAVAYDKTGQHELAIETALKTEQSAPARYETAANLGTFRFHAGHPEESIPDIERALKINPDAHFGRERYQKWLTEYVLHRRKGGPLTLPLAKVTVPPGADRAALKSHDVGVTDTFAQFLGKERRGHLTHDEAAAAVKGVLGMMRFAKHDSPILLEALGTLLVQEGHEPERDAKLLAARAFLKAAAEVPDGPARADYRAMAVRALQMQTVRTELKEISLPQVEADFEKELADAQGWYAELRDRELLWIRDGRDPEAEFDRLYDADPALPGMDLRDPMSAPAKYVLVAIIALSVIGVVVVALVVWAAFRIWRWIRRTPLN